MSRQAGTVRAICISQMKGSPKQPVNTAELQREHGIVGDAHAGDGMRQVSLLPQESIARMQTLMPEIDDGSFAENIVTSGLDLSQAAEGDRLQLGNVIVLEVTQIGKECHNSCAIRSTVGDCIMPREGVFCRVLQGGSLHCGDSIRWQTT